MAVSQQGRSRRHECFCLIATQSLHEKRSARRFSAQLLPCAYITSSSRDFSSIQKLQRKTGADAFCVTSCRTATQFAAESDAKSARLTASQFLNLPAPQSCCCLSSSIYVPASVCRKWLSLQNCALGARALNAKSVPPTAYPPVKQRWFFSRVKSKPSAAGKGLGSTSSGSRCLRNKLRISSHAAVTSLAWGCITPRRCKVRKTQQDLHAPRTIARPP